MAFRPLPSFGARLVVALTLAIPFGAVADSNGDTSYLNVYGEALHSCSSDGMALTGYTRSGSCVDENDDSGSHHICIDLSSLGGDGGEDNFCDVTGQSDWCSYEDMPCHEDADDSSCPVQNWCVCQWAFASYIQGSGGCDNIQSVVCDSINQQALLAYQKVISKRNPEQKYRDALECLVDRCGLDSNYLSAMTSASSSRSIYGGVFLASMTLAAVTAYVYRKRSASKKNELDKGYVGAEDVKDDPTIATQEIS